MDNGGFISFVFLVSGVLAGAAYLALKAAADPGLILILFASVVAAIGLAGLALLIQLVVRLERPGRRT